MAWLGMLPSRFRASGSIMQLFRFTQHSTDHTVHGVQRRLMPLSKLTHVTVKVCNQSLYTMTNVLHMLQLVADDYADCEEKGSSRQRHAAAKINT